MAEKRHNELVSAIRALESKLGAPAEVYDSVPEMRECIKKIEALISAVSSIPKPEAPVVKVENKNDDMVRAMSGIAEKISELQAQPPAVEQPQKLPRRYVFEFKRNFTGLIESPIAVDVIYST